MDGEWLGRRVVAGSLDGNLLLADASNRVWLDLWQECALVMHDDLQAGLLRRVEARPIGVIRVVLGVHSRWPVVASGPELGAVMLGDGVGREGNEKTRTREPDAREGWNTPGLGETQTM